MLAIINYVVLPCVLLRKSLRQKKPWNKWAHTHSKTSHSLLFVKWRMSLACFFLFLFCLLSLLVFWSPIYAAPALRGGKRGGRPGALKPWGPQFVWSSIRQQYKWWCTYWCCMTKKEIMLHAGIAYLCLWGWNPPSVSLVFQSSHRQFNRRTYQWPQAS